MVNEIIEKINLNMRNKKTSKKFKILAKYILEHTNEIPFLNLKALSEKSEISTATIVRFSKFLGFKGYSELQVNFKNYLKKELVPTKELKESIASNKENSEVFNEIIDTNIEMLSILKKEIDFKNLEEIISLLANANKIFIIGNRLSYSFAYYLYYLLKEIKEKVEIITSEREDYTHKLLYVQPNDVVFSICFYPYVDFTYKITNYLKKEKCKIITLTDDLRSPFISLADKILYASNNNSSYSFITAITILNIIVTLLGKRNKENSLKQLKKLKEISNLLDIYYKGN